MARILVTGGAGFIGSHLVDQLVNKHRVTVLDDLSTGKRKFVNNKAEFVKGKIQNKNVIQLFKKKKFDYVYHLAAQKNLHYSKEHPVEDAEINILGSLNIIDASKKTGVKKVIFYSTAAVYDPDAKPPNKETDTPNPKTPYGIAKYAVEKYLAASGISYTVLRLANVYGPRQDTKGEGGVVAIFCNAFIGNKSPKIYNSGNQTRDFVYVFDVVSASLKTLVKGNNQTCNISHGKEISINQLYTLFNQVAKKNLPPIRGEQVQEQYRSSLRNGKAKKTLNWKPAFTLYRGLNDYYYRTHE